ncbi:mechanosensitive ion channel protein MscS [Sulfitobacter sp. SK012]|uniref:mechanosensitive ion channel family protein n=1 Tax=Sulfitobacter sp. SK012 TaxID=1389005 RepID=UPI000E0AD835|nr:mechanosensitive ion channel domain-containing protein [Sulfitobacter sp. SK012]AXI45762.1 mechanosensitive ion channel protein MscS [Sulfitobacter sp. SK012]
MKQITFWRTGSLRSFVFILLAGLSILLFATDRSAAQEQENVSPPEQVEQLPEGVFSAPVIVEGEVLFAVRGSSALPASIRAEKIVERILSVAEQSKAAAVTVSVEKHELGLGIVANGVLITVTTDADAEMDSFDIEVLASLHSESIQGAIEKYRFDRSDTARVESAMAAVAWTVGFLLITFVFARWRLRVGAALAFIAEKYFSKFEKATGSVVRGRAIGKLTGYLVQVALWTGYLFLLYYYLSFVLLSFAETRPFAQILLTYVSEPLISVILGFIAYLPNLVTIVIIALVTRFMIRGFRLLMDNVEAGTISIQNFEPHWITPTFNLARVAIIAVAIVFAYPHLPGAGSKAFQGLTILAGIMVSLGSNTVVSNMMAGLFVIYRRSTNIGDRIKVGEQIGDVVEIRLMETLIKSIKNEMISIPNAQLLNSEVVNYSRKIDGRGLLLHTTVGIGYEEPQEKIEAMLVEAANRTRDLRKSPEPFVLITALADYAINYQVNAFTTRGSSLPRILSDLHRHIITVFNENNVQIMTPSYMADTEIAKIPTESWDGKLAPSTEKAV